MSTEITYYCDFCEEEVGNLSGASIEGGFAMNANGQWTTSLDQDIEGSHVCFKCIRKLLRSEYSDVLVKSINTPD